MKSGGKAGLAEHPSQCITPGRPGMEREVGPEKVRTTELGSGGGADAKEIP